MSNDIQKYRYLIETIILDESFKDAERIFTDTVVIKKRFQVI